MSKTLCVFALVWLSVTDEEFRKGIQVWRPMLESNQVTKSYSLTSLWMTGRAFHVGVAKGQITTSLQLVNVRFHTNSSGIPTLTP
jgi:hypothetical protein